MCVGECKINFVVFVSMGECSFGCLLQQKKCVKLNFISHHYSKTNETYLKLTAAICMTGHTVLRSLLMTGPPFLRCSPIRTVVKSFINRS